MTAILLSLAILATADDGDGEPKSSPSPAVGHWVGTLDLGPIALTLILHVDEGEGGLEARLDSPDQGKDHMEVERISLEGRTLRFESPKILATYEGTLDEQGDSIDGTFTQAGRATPLVLKKTVEADLPGVVSAPEELRGIWEGPIELPGGVNLRVALRVEPAPDAEERLTAVFDSIDQDVRGIPVTSVSLEDEAVTFEVGSIGGRFEGDLDGDRASIEGTWTQLGNAFPLTLTRVEQVSSLRRPQHPEGPFPYQVEDVTFPNVEDAIELSGTLTLPEGSGPFPAAVLASGSGPQDRNETLLGHKPFLVIADHLTRAGIAVLRFDDRGVGGSGGDHAEATTEDFAGDALAAVALLRGRIEIDRDAVGIVGHSEGGLIGPLAASRDRDAVGFLVLLAGPGVPGSEILLHQSDRIARAGGASEEAIAAQHSATERLIALVLSGDADDPEAGRLAEEATAALGPEQREALDEANAAPTDVGPEDPGALDTPWFRFFLAHDPRSTLRQVECPVLALFGANDLQVDPAQNAEPLETALRDGDGPEPEVVILPGLNHLFQHSETGSPAEYGSIEETFAPEALDRIADWILETTRGGGGRKTEDKRQ